MAKLQGDAKLLQRQTTEKEEQKTRKAVSSYNQTENYHKVMQDDQRKTKNSYKIKEYSYKKTESDYKETETDYKETQNDHEEM